MLTSRELIPTGQLKQHSILQQKSPLHYVDRYLETLKVYSFCLQLASNPAGYFCRRIFSQPQEWSQINYGDESTSSQTVNYHLCIFSDMKVTDLVENFKNISIEKAWTWYALANRIEPNSRTFSKFFPHYKFQIQRFNCKISPGLAQPVNRAASTTAYDGMNKALFFQIL